MPTTFNDTDTICAICLDTLHSDTSTTLSCGHRYHTTCLVSQLEQSTPIPGRRIILHGTRCAKCQQVVECPSLAHVITPAQELHQLINALIDVQIRVDGLEHHPDVQSEGIYQFGKRYYAFYLCSICKSPYLGGTIECGDGEDGPHPAPQNAQRFCHTCHVIPPRTCTNIEHVPFYVWKCRYCCRVAEYVCYGSTHLCSHCHGLNDRRERHGTELQPTPCTCPNLTEQEKHSNGPDLSCEQVLSCIACETEPPQSQFTSRNLIYNGNAEHALRAWHQITHSAWSVERSENPSFSTYNFVSSYNLHVAAQIVDLTRYLRRFDLGIEVAARYMGRTDCPSHFRLRAVALDISGVKVADLRGDRKQCPPGYWEREVLTFAGNERIRYIVVFLEGQDDRFWQGWYGAKVTDVSVKVKLNEQGQLDEQEVMLDTEVTGNISTHVQTLLDLKQYSRPYNYSYLDQYSD